MSEPNESNSYADYPPVAKWGRWLLKLLIIIVAIVSARLLVDMLGRVFF